MKTQKFENGGFENSSHSFVNRLLMTIAFKVATGAFLTDMNKRLCLEKGFNNAALVEQCERLSFS